MIVWTMLQIAGDWLSHALAFAVEWISFVGSGGLILLGIALILYSAVAVGLLRLFAVPAGIVAITAGLYLAFITYGASERAAGVAEERARWEAASEAERQRQAAAKAAIEVLGQQIAASVASTVAGLEPILNQLKVEATKEDGSPPPPPPPPGCPDVYRGLPPGSLLKLDAFGR